ncbi:unnamed protein product [Lupinus luteus]|uniref:Uncharacterized protein n=1 Tax=Lupinus luteus TaxID=3873 RepID=A0AAV1W1I9_LUPLU
MVIPNGEEKKANLTIKWVIKNPTNDDQNLTPNRNMEPEMNQAAEASTSKNPTTVATPQTDGGISSEGCSCNEGVNPKLVISLKRIRANDEKEDEQQQESKVVPKNSLPWNLRTRQSHCETANDLRKNSDDKIQRSEIKVELTKKEIKEDLKVMLGHPLRGKPKKRPKVVQNHLDNVFPGLNLKDITAKSYKVPKSPSC